jgi:predicted chitinase
MVSSPARSHVLDLSDITNRIEGGRNGMGDEKV